MPAANPITRVPCDYTENTPAAADVTHLLSRILDTDPEKRAAVKEIRAHAWYVGAYPPSSRPTAAPFPVVPLRRSDLDDKLLTRAVTLAGSGGGGSGKGGGRGPEAGGEQALTAAAIKAAAEGLLSGRHDPVGTAYHLLLKRSLRERNGLRPVPPTVTGGQDAQNHEQSCAKSRPSAAVGAGKIDTGTGNGDNRGGVDNAARADRAYGPAPRPPGAVTVRAAEIVRGNASYASSTSSSRSGQQPAARRRKSSTTAPTSEGNSFRLAATAAARGGDSSGSDIARPRPKVDPREGRPQSAIVSRTVRPSAAVTAPIRQGSKEGSERPPEGVRKATITGTADRPVPLLSFRGIARTEARDAAEGDGGGGNGKPFSSAAFTSQTARASSGGYPANQAAPAKQRIGGATHARRESAGSSSSSGSTGSGSRKTPPRRPRTARAPLRSSTPTPRLSGDFSLARPRGAPISTAGGNRATTAVPSPRVARVSPGNGRPCKAAAPLAAGPVVGAPTTTTTLSVTKPRSDGGEQAVVLSAPPRPTAQQPSLRVRLSTLSAKVPQRQRETGGDETNVAVAGVSAATEAADKSGRISRPPPRRPSGSSTVSSAAEAAEVSPAGGVKAGRAFWGKLSAPGGPPRGLRAPHASAKGWARGAPIVFRSMNSASPAAVPATGAAPIGSGQSSSAGA